MTPFDATAHALSTVSTGGFSTRAAGVLASFDSIGVDIVLDGLHDRRRIELRHPCGP